MKIYYLLQTTAAVVLFVASFWGYRLVQTEQTEHQKVAEALFHQVAEKATHDIQALELEGQVAAISRGSQESQVLTTILSEVLHRSGIRVVQPSLFQQATEKFYSQFYESDQPLELMVSGYLIESELLSLQTLPSNKSCKVHLQILQLPNKAVFFEETYQVPKKANSETKPLLIGERSSFPFWIFSIWLLVVLGLPWGFRRAILAVLKNESNLQNFMLLIGYLTLALILYHFVLYQLSTLGLTTVAMVIFLLVLLSLYFSYVCYLLEKIES